METLNKNFNLMISQLKSQQQKLILSERHSAWEHVARKLAHEIKNPLSSLRSATETFSRAKKAAQKKQLLGVILQDVQRLDRLITDISQASRIDHEIMGQNLELVDHFGVNKNLDHNPNIQYNLSLYNRKQSDQHIIDYFIIHLILECLHFHHNQHNYHPNIQ